MQLVSIAVKGVKTQGDPGLFAAFRIVFIQGKPPCPAVPDIALVILFGQIQAGVKLVFPDRVDKEGVQIRIRHGNTQGDPLLRPIPDHRILFIVFPFVKSFAFCDLGTVPIGDRVFRSRIAFARDGICPVRTGLPESGLRSHPEPAKGKRLL